MKIKIDENYRVHVCDALLGVQGESNSRTIHVEQPAVPGVVISVLRVLTGVMVTDADGVAHPECVDIPCADGESVVPAPALAHAGIVKMQWIASDSSGEIVAKSPVFSAMVAESLEDAQAIPDYDTIMSKLDEFTALSARVEQEQRELEEMIRQYGKYPGVSTDEGNTLETRENGLYTAGGGGGGDIQIDTTLTKSGFAADAKVVGDRLTVHGNQIYENGMSITNIIMTIQPLQISVATAGKKADEAKAGVSSLGTAVDNLSTSLATVQNAMATKNDLAIVSTTVQALQADVNELKGISALLDTLVEV